MTLALFVLAYLSVGVGMTLYHDHARAKTPSDAGTMAMMAVMWAPITLWVAGCVVVERIEREIK